jgi:hypothetical protein
MGFFYADKKSKNECMQDISAHQHAQGKKQAGHRLDVISGRQLMLKRL